jgi:hypothetical protein
MSDSPLAGLPESPFEFDRDRSWLLDANKNVIAVLPTTALFETRVAIGNAFAAVPQMLMALAICEKTLTGIYRSYGLSDGEIDDLEVIRDIRAVLARAHGKLPSLTEAAQAREEPPHADE